VHARRNRLARAVGNLLDNAIKFSPEAGTVTNSGVLVNSSFGDFVFAELVNGQNWLLQA